MTRYPAIFITGCARSGTSLVAGLFAKTGRFMGENLIPARSSNPKGFHESLQINAVNEQILLRYLPGAYRHGSVAYRMDAPGTTHTWLSRIGPEVNISANDAERAYMRALFGRGPCCFKDPRFCYTIDEWIEAAQREYRVICVFREPDITVSSIFNEIRSQPYLWDLAISVTQAFEVWELMYRRVLDRRPDRNWLFVSFDDLISGLALDRIAAFTEEKIDRDFPTAELRRSSREFQTPEHVEAVHQELIARSRAEP